MGFDQMKLEYIDPTGHTWQLQGPDQNAHPVVLLRRPVGLQGAPIEVQRRKVLRSRESFRVATMVQSREIEMTVQLAADGASAMYGLLRKWHDAWPENDDEYYASDGRTFGQLKSTAPTGEVRFLDVYRTEEMESLTPLDPLVALRQRYLMVVSSDDPYPYGVPVAQSGALPAGKPVQVTLVNQGEVPVSPRLTINAGKSNVSIKATRKTASGVETLTNFSLQMLARGTFDLDPDTLTFTYEGDVLPITYWWKPRDNFPGIKAGEVKPIAAPWDQNADLVLPPGQAVTLTLTSSTAGVYACSYTPRYRRFMF